MIFGSEEVNPPGPDHKITYGSVPPPIAGAIDPVDSPEHTLVTVGVASSNSGSSINTTPKASQLSAPTMWY